MRKLLNYAILLLSLLTAVSCVMEEVELPAGGSGDREVVISFRLPDSQAATRSLTPGQETAVDEIEVLAFIKGADNKYYYGYRARPTEKTITDGTGTFKVNLKQYPEEQRFMILANGITETGAAAILPDDEYSVVQAKLIAQCEDYWPADNNGNGVIRKFPMYAETTPQVITSTTLALTTPDHSPHRFIRMVARVNVKLKATVDNFELKEAYVFQRKTCGYLAYNGNFTASPKTAWIPSAHPAGDPLTIKYLDTDEPYEATGTGVDSKIENSIYTFEAAGVTDRTKATAIVVGGYFGYPANTTEMTYYRIDIKTADTPAGYICQDIVRNHSYNITIQEVAGPGEETPEEAYDGVPGLTANVSVWNDDPVNTIFDGEYRMTFSRDKVVFGSDAVTQTEVEVIVETDYIAENGAMPDKNNPSAAPVGLNVFRYYPSAWLDVSWETQETDSKGNPKKVKFVIKDILENTTGKQRSVVIELRSGNMRYSYKIIQNPDPWLRLSSYVHVMDGAMHAIKTNATTLWQVDLMQNPAPADGGLELLTEKGDVENDYMWIRTHDDRADQLLYTATSRLRFTDLSGQNDPQEIDIISVSGIQEVVSSTYMYTPDTPAHPIRPRLIPTTIANWSSLGLQLSEFDELSASLLWIDHENGVEFDAQKGPSVLKRILPVCSGGHGFVYVELGSQEGSASIALSHGGEVMWSWYLWITEYQPDAIPTPAATGVYTVPANDKGPVAGQGKVYRFTSPSGKEYVVMDRHLGAERAEMTDYGRDPEQWNEPSFVDSYNKEWTETLGSYFQWGRKDAWPKEISQFTDATHSTVIGECYDAKGVRHHPDQEIQSTLDSDRKTLPGRDRYR